nr:folylpolyglutamate synthase/dihydrofolate synthase family protein [Deinococcus peraridilitoris]
MTQALSWLFAQQRFGVHPGLARVRELLDRLGSPQRSFDVVLVGGTNGKGSTSAVLAGMLQASGIRVGLFTSPHLTRFAERFQVDGQELPEECVEEALLRVQPHAEAVGATFFEIVTALGVLLFAEASVRLAVMEVGLGGRLDATNALEPLLSVVTTVGFDHTEVLGSTLEQIAAEKAGILRWGGLAVTGVEGAALEILQGREADLWVLGRDAPYEVEAQGWNGSWVRLSSPVGQVEFGTGLLGEHGARNAALAALAALRLGVGTEAIARGAVTARWPGRLERLCWQGREVLLDGAHNVDGARALARTLSSLGMTPVPLIFGVSEGKDVERIVHELTPTVSEVILTRATLSPRASRPETLTTLWNVPVRVAATPEEALAMLPEGPAVVAGSLYLIGEVRPLLLGEAVEQRERWQ